MFPTHQIAYVGASVTISCVGTLNFTKWYKHGDAIPFYYIRAHNTSASDITLLISIKSVQLKDAGIYACAGWRTVNNNTRYGIEYARLEVGGKIKFKLLQNTCVLN